MKYEKEWFNDDNFWKNFAPIIFDNKRWAEVPGTADAITRLSALSLYGKKSDARTGPRALDLCCGMGRITAELARRGFAATGVDITASFLETAR